MKLSILLITIITLNDAVKRKNPLRLFNSYHFKVGIPNAAKLKLLEERSQCTEYDDRIVGGEPTDVSQIPYQAGLIISVMTVFTSVCGGALIAKNKVLTAAHCHDDGVVSARQFTVVLGSSTLFSGGERLRATNIVIHSQWDPTTAKNDIAVLTIPEVKFTEKIQPINLPTERHKFRNFESQLVLVSGYGLSSDYSMISPNSSLQAVWLKIVPNEECQKNFDEWYHESNICVSGDDGKSTCSGDSGGPMVKVKGKVKVLIGLTSFGYASCDLGKPMAFTRITSYLCWIKSNS